MSYVKNNDWLNPDRDKDGINWSHVGRFMLYYKPYRRHLIFAVSLSFVFSLAAYLIPKVFSAVQVAIESRESSAVAWALGAYAGIVLMQSAATYLISRQRAKISTALNRDVLLEYYQRLLNSTVPAFLKFKKNSNLFQRVIDAMSTTGPVTDVVINGAYAVVTAVAFAWVIGSLSWPVLVVLLVGVGISAWHTLHFSPKLSERRRKTLAVNYPLVGRMLELIGGLLTVKSLSATVQVTGDVKGLVSEKEGCEYEEALYSAGMNFASSTIRDLTLVAAIATAFALLLGGQLALSDLFAIYVLAGGFVGPAGQVVSIYRTISVTAANLRNYYEVIDIESESPADAAQAGQPAGRVPAVAAVSGDGYAGDGMAQASVPTLALADDRPVGEIEFDQLTFGYADDTKVIDNLSLTVEPGERIALIGRSGAGKTTLIRLLLGFLEPQAGSIRVDGLDLKDYRNKDLFRQRFGVVGQDALLFNVSVRENLLFGLTEPREDEEIREVLDLVNLLDHVEGLSNGLDTVFTSDEFSGGQRQRLAVARALIRRPDIVLLDEPTSALDFENEREVVNALDRLVRGKTTITIAHRLSTVQDADRVVVLDQGQVVAAGPHAVLYETNDYYRSMCEYNSFIV